MAADQLRNENCMELVVHPGKVVAAIELSETRSPRAGEWIALLDRGNETAATYLVERVIYCYGMRAGTLSLLKITVEVELGTTSN